MYRKSRDAAVKTETQPEPSERTNQPLRLTDHYIALLVLIFTNAGLLDVSAPVRHITFLALMYIKALTAMLEESTTATEVFHAA